MFMKLTDEDKAKIMFIRMSGTDDDVLLFIAKKKRNRVRRWYKRDITAGNWHGIKYICYICGETINFNYSALMNKNTRSKLEAHKKIHLKEIFE